MREFLHDWLLGHRYRWEDDGATPVFTCSCGKHWWVGFTRQHPTKRDRFDTYNHATQ